MEVIREKGKGKGKGKRKGKREKEAGPGEPTGAGTTAPPLDIE